MDFCVMNSTVPLINSAYLEFVLIHFVLIVSMALKDYFALAMFAIVMMHHVLLEIA